MDDCAEENHAYTERAHAFPAEMLPAGGPGVRADRARGEIADHIDHVQSASRFGKESVNSRLIGDVTGLDSEVEKDHSDDQTRHVTAEHPEDNKCDEHDEQGEGDIAACSAPVGPTPDQWGARGTDGADETEQSSDGAAVMIRRTLQEKYQGRPKGAERSKEGRANETGFDQHRLGTDQRSRGANELGPTQR